MGGVAVADPGRPQPTRGHPSQISARDEPGQRVFSGNGAPGGVAFPASERRRETGDTDPYERQPIGAPFGGSRPGRVANAASGGYETNHGYSVGRHQFNDAERRFIDRLANVSGGGFRILRSASQSGNRRYRFSGRTVNATAEPFRLAYAWRRFLSQPVGRPTGRNGDTAISAIDGAMEWRPGPLNGFWRNADWLFCTDGKWRPVEPGTRPLAYGLPLKLAALGSGLERLCTVAGADRDSLKRAKAYRVGTLKGYGNAISPEPAIAFIESWMDFAPL